MQPIDYLQNIPPSLIQDATNKPGKSSRWYAGMYLICHPGTQELYWIEHRTKADLWDIEEWLITRLSGDIIGSYDTLRDCVAYFKPSEPQKAVEPTLTRQHWQKLESAYRATFSHTADYWYKKQHGISPHDYLDRELAAFPRTYALWWASRSQLHSRNFRGRARGFIGWINLNRAQKFRRIRAHLAHDALRHNRISYAQYWSYTRDDNSWQRINGNPITV